MIFSIEEKWIGEMCNSFGASCLNWIVIIIYYFQCIWRVHHQVGKQGQIWVCSDNDGIQVVLDEMKQFLSNNRGGGVNLPNQTNIPTNLMKINVLIWFCFVLGEYRESNVCLTRASKAGNTCIWEMIYAWW